MLPDIVVWPWMIGLSVVLMWRNIEVALSVFCAVVLVRLGVIYGSPHSDIYVVGVWAIVALVTYRLDYLLPACFAAMISLCDVLFFFKLFSWEVAQLLSEVFVFVLLIAGGWLGGQRVRVPQRLGDRHTDYIVSDRRLHCAPSNSLGQAPNSANSKNRSPLNTMGGVSHSAVSSKVGRT